MCGSTSAQDQLQQEQLDAYKQAQEMTAEEYANQQAIYKPMADQFESIFKMGPNQKGFSDEERNDLNAQAVTGTATNYAQASKAVGEQLAARGGGDEFITSGGDAELKSEVAQSAAEQESQQETQIKEADYSKGYEEWMQSASGLESIAAGENPIGYENAATSSGSAAGTTASQIAEEDNSWINAAIGAAGEIGAGFACVAKGSLILMADGSKRRVEILEPGDQIVGIDGEEQTVHQVLGTRSIILRIETEDGHIARCSPTHAFVHPYGGFTTAVRSGSTMLVTDQGESRVKELTAHGAGLVYNLIMDGSHTYCADGIWAVGDDMKVRAE